MVGIMFNKYNKITVRMTAVALLVLLCETQGERAAMAQSNEDLVHPDFVELRELIPDIRLEVRYFGEHNFVGRSIDGYNAEKIFMTRQAAEALSRVQAELVSFGHSLKVFDAYRPQRAVDHFVRWAEDLNDKKMKEEFYPAVNKADLFSSGYIAARSGHSRGSTIDLTIVDAETGKELEMGTPWDYFDPSSWPTYLEIPDQARANRNLLAAVMTKHGFRALPEEWWHFTLENEPFPDTYFDFPVE